MNQSLTTPFLNTAPEFVFVDETGCDDTVTGNCFSVPGPLGEILMLPACCAQTKEMAAPNDNKVNKSFFIVNEFECTGYVPKIIEIKKLVARGIKFCKSNIKVLNKSAVWKAYNGVI